MQRSVSIRRPLLVSGRYVLLNIILDMPLAYGLTTRPRANTIIDTVTYLVDGTYYSTDNEIVPRTTLDCISTVVVWDYPHAWNLNKHGRR